MLHAVVAIGVLLQEKAAFTVDQTPDAVIVTSDGKEVLRYWLKKEWMAEELALGGEGLHVALRRQGPANVLDLAYTLTTDGDIQLPKWAFSGFCLRARKDGKATVEGPEGEVKLPAPNHLKPES